MNYDYTPQLADIGLTRIRGNVGRGIRLGQWLNGDGFADFEHAMVHTGNRMIVEAEPGGAREVELWYPPEMVVWLRCPDKHREAVAEAARGLVGVPYSFADYASLALHRLHIPAPHLRSYIRSSQHAICSQLADHAALLGGWHIFTDGRWEGDVTPGDLYREYRKQQAALAAS
jgi:hypothetical protein